jgi:hypothetical protein
MKSCVSVESTETQLTPSIPISWSGISAKNRSHFFASRSRELIEVESAPFIRPVGATALPAGLVNRTARVVF